MLSKIRNSRSTLADQVEKQLLDYFVEKGFTVGSSIPNEMELAESLGVGRSVVREALSRFKMMGMIETRTKVGMTLSEPSLFSGLERCINPYLLSERTMESLLEFRVAIELGISKLIFRNITEEDLAELEHIVASAGAPKHNKYTLLSEYEFHTKLYRITHNKAIIEFQKLIHPIMEFIKQKEADVFNELRKGDIVTHRDLLELLKKGDVEGYEKALERHFNIYTIYLQQTMQ